MATTVACRVDSSSAAERILEELARACGCERTDMRVTTQGSQTSITVHAGSERAGRCAAEVMQKLGAANVEQGSDSSEPGTTGPIDIVRQPGEDRLPTPDELPVGNVATSNGQERPSRSAAHEVDADRRRAHAPYSGKERRAR